MPLAKKFKLLPEETVISSITRTKKELKNKGLKFKFIRDCYAIIHRLIGVKKANKIFYKISTKKLNNKYDLVVAYQEGAIAEYVQYIKSSKRIAWCHTAYEYFSGGNGQSYWRNIYYKYEPGCSKVRGRKLE